MTSRYGGGTEGGDQAGSGASVNFLKSSFGSNVHNVKSNEQPKNSMLMSRGMSMRSSRRGNESKAKLKKEDKARIIINGKDLTPKPLSLEAIPQDSKNPNQSSAQLSTIQSMKFSSLESINSSALGSSSSMRDSGLAGGKSTAYLSTDGESESAPVPTKTSTSMSQIPEEDTDGENKPLMDYNPPLGEQELESIVTIQIEETETFTLFHIPSTRVWAEEEVVHREALQRNKNYEQLLQDHKTKDKFATRGAQTFNETVREKEIQASPPVLLESSVQVTTWDIYDAFNNSGTQTATAETEDNTAALVLDASTGTVGDAGLLDGDDVKIGGSQTGGTPSDTPQGSFLGSSASILDRQDSTRRGPAVASEISTPSVYERICRLPQFHESLLIMERALCQTEMRDEQLLYRNYQPVKRVAGNAPADNVLPEADARVLEEPKPIKKSRELVPLWRYATDAKGLGVTCMDWNKQNKDLLAVGYGRTDFGSHASGLILFWSLRNPEQPEKVIHTKHSVVSMDFCAELPHLLAVGLYNGSVVLYDIRDSGERPFMESAHASGKHSEPVWGLKWVSRRQGSGDGAQQLTSISSDGTVYNWSMRKGLIPHEIMQLKRVPNLAKFQDTAVDGVSRQASGLCFDFSLTDEAQYLAGTEDGIIHKCSTSYNEQTLENFYGHTAAVYKVAYSPFASDVFLSCSADWTSALWTQKSTKPIALFQSGSDSVVDIRWSPFNSCVFCNAYHDGRVELWDLEESMLDPVIRLSSSQGPKTCVLFAMDSPVLLTGGADGVVEVFRIHGSEPETKLTNEQQASRLLDALYEHSSNEFKAKDGGENGAADEESAAP